MPTWFIEVSETPVNDEHIPCFVIHQDILRLDITMNDPTTVCIIQTNQHLVQIVPEFMIC